MFTKAFWEGALERAIRSGAQFALLVLGVGVTAGAGDSETAQAINAFALDYAALAGAFMGGVIMSVLTSLVLPAHVPVIPDGTGKRVARDDSE